MSLLSTVSRKSMPGAITLATAKPLSSLPKLPALPAVSTIGALPVRPVGLIVNKAAVGPSSLLRSLGVQSPGGKSLGF